MTLKTASFLSSTAIPNPREVSFLRRPEIDSDSFFVVFSALLPSLAPKGADILSAAAVCSDDRFERVRQIGIRRSMAADGAAENRPAGSQMHTFNSTGRAVHPNRARLLDEVRAQIDAAVAARETLPMKSYRCDNRFYSDGRWVCFDAHLFDGRTHGEALLAFLDFLNENVLTRDGKDNYVPEDDEDLVVEDFFDKGRGSREVWLKEATPVVAHHRVSELIRTKAARVFE